MATSLTLEQTTFNSKNITRSVTNISSSANDSQLYEFAEALNGLTTNTLNKVNRIDKREIKDPSEKIARTLTANPAHVGGETITDITFTYVGDGTLSATHMENNNLIVEILSNTKARVLYNADLGNPAITFTISETETYQAASAIVAFN